MNKDPPNNIAFAFRKLKKEVKGVRHVFIFSKHATTNLKEDFERELGPLIATLSRKSSLKKICIEAVKGGIIMYVTETFFLGAVLNGEANPMLVEMILGRIATNLDTSFESFKTISMSVLEEMVQERIESLTPFRTSTVTVTLISRDLGVEGEITLTAGYREHNQLKEEIQEILDEEIPFFLKKSINIDIKTN